MQELAPIDKNGEKVANGKHLVDQELKVDGKHMAGIRGPRPTGSPWPMGIPRPAGSS